MMSITSLWHRFVAHLPTRAESSHAASQRLLAASAAASAMLTATASEAADAITRVETRLGERRAHPRAMKSAQG